MKLRYTVAFADPIRKANYSRMIGSGRRRRSHSRPKDRMKPSFILLAVCLIPLGVAAEPLRVFVSVLPQQTFVERIGGEHVEVHAMVQPGHSPATYDPSPRQIGALAEAELYVRTGVPFETGWMDRIRSANPQMRILDARSGIDLRAVEAHDHDHGNSHRGHAEHHSPEGLDPHIWTSSILVQRMALTIRDALTALDPDHGPAYERNFAVLAAELEALDREIRSALREMRGRRFMVFHPAWGYFADAYGLVQVPIEKEGKRPGPRQLAALIEQAKREDVKVIFVQPQFDREAARQVARADASGSIATTRPPIARATCRAASRSNWGWTKITLTASRFACSVNAAS